MIEYPLQHTFAVTFHTREDTYIGKVELKDLQKENKWKKILSTVIKMEQTSNIKINSVPNWVETSTWNE